MEGSPALVTNDTTRAEREGVAGHVAGRQMIRVTEVELFPPPFFPPHPWI
jgi:hypothetical protein